MKVYLVYGLDSDDFCEEPFVKKVFRNEEKALEYLNKKAISPSINENWDVVEMEVEE
jgi:hypothetical protein